MRFFSAYEANFTIVECPLWVISGPLAPFYSDVRFRVHNGHSKLGHGFIRCRPDRRYTRVCRYAVWDAIGQQDFQQRIERQVADQQQIALIDRDENRTDDSADPQAAQDYVFS